MWSWVSNMFFKKIWNAIKSFAIKTYKEVKGLGWFFGSIAVLIAVIIFYLPSIVAFILYVTTSQGGYLAFAIGYAVWWFSPAFSPALLTYMAILLFITKLFYFILRKKRRGVSL